MTETPPPPGGSPLGPIDEIPWAAFTPDELAPLLEGLDVRWRVSAGWAVDLFVGRQTREHEDLEIAVPDSAFPVLRRHLSRFDFVVPGSTSPGQGHTWPADEAALAWSHQTWARDGDGLFRFDVFREPHDGDTWICRRDTSIRRPYREVVRVTAEGTPYEAPEVVLLFKAKHARPKDEADLDTVLPLLDAAVLDWLHHALTQVHPDHPWAERVRAAGG